MKKTIAILFVGSLFCYSCGVDTARINKMADEMCEAMKLFDDENPMSDMVAQSALLKIVENEEEYGDVTDKQLFKAMKERCPDGAQELKDRGITLRDNTPLE